MTLDADELVERIATELRSRAEPPRVPAMTRYMRDQFPFLGVMAAGQKEAWRAATAGQPRSLPEPVVATAAEALWRRPEREFQYLGCTLVNQHAATTAASLGFLGVVGRCIQTKPWWDTVDALATRGVGSLVQRHPAHRAAMDTWLHGDDMWLTRSALLHMNRWKAATDRDWLFAACLALAAHKDFFIRKAIGWALREYSKVDEDAVVAFVRDNADRLSGLSRREALMWLERRRRRLER